MSASASSTSTGLTLNNLSSPSLPFRPYRPNQPTKLPSSSLSQRLPKAPSIPRLYPGLAQTQQSIRLVLFGASIVDACTNKQKLVVQKIESGIQLTVYSLCCVAWS